MSAGVSLAGKPPAADGPSGLEALARGGLLNLVGGAVSGVFGLALVVVVSRGLGASRTGVFFEAVALFTILSSVAEFGASTGMVRLVARSRGDVGRIESLYRVALLPVLAGSAVVAVALFTLAPVIAELVVDEGTVPLMTDYVRALCWFLPAATGASVVLAGTRGFGTMLPFVALESTMKPLLRLLLIWLVIAAGLGAGAVTAGWALPMALTFPLGLLAFVRMVRAARRAQVGGEEIREPWRNAARDFWRFAAPRGLATIFQLSVLWLDILLVGALRGAREAGIYAAVSRFVLVGALAIEAVRFAIAPQLSRLLGLGDHREAEHLYQRGTWWLMALSWPFYLSILFFTPTIVSLFGPEFAEGAVPLAILSVAMLANTGTGNVTVVLLMGGKSSWNLANTVAALVANVTLNLLLIPPLGVTGAAIAWSVSILVENGAALVQIKRFFGIRPFGSGYLRVVAAAVVTFGPVGLLVRTFVGSGPGALAVFAAGAVPLFALAIWRSRRELDLGVLADAVPGLGRRRRARRSGSEG